MRTLLLVCASPLGLPVAARIAAKLILLYLINKDMTIAMQRLLGIEDSQCIIHDAQQVSERPSILTPTPNRATIAPAYGAAL